MKLFTTLVLVLLVVLVGCSDAKYDIAKASPKSAAAAIANLELDKKQVKESIKERGEIFANGFMDDQAQEETANDMRKLTERLKDIQLDINAWKVAIRKAKKK